MGNSKFRGIVEAPDFFPTIGTEALVDDTPQQLTVASASEWIYTGTGSKADRILPDATTLAIGRKFTLVNASSQFMPVQNYGTASSVFELLGPGCTLTATLLTAAGSAAGTWAVTRSNPEGYPKYENDFFSTGDGVATTSPGGCRANAGTGSSSTTRDQVNRRGVGLMALGSDAGLGGWVLFSYDGYDNNSIQKSSGKPVMMRVLFDTYAIPDGTQKWTLRHGYLDQIDGTQPTLGIYFESHVDTGVINGITRAAGTQTLVAGDVIKTQASALPSDGAWIINAAGSRVDFWLDKAYLGSSTTNLPNMVTSGGILATQFDRVAGVGVSQVQIDYVTFEKPR